MCYIMQSFHRSGSTHNEWICEKKNFQKNSKNSYKKISKNAETSKILVFLCLKKIVSKGILNLYCTSDVCCRFK